LPPGMVVPEGWSVMPLRRADAGGYGAAAAAAPVVGDNGGSASAETVEGRGAILADVEAILADPSAGLATSSRNTTAPDLAAASGALGPTDDRGSPLFVPATYDPSTVDNTAPIGNASSAGPIRPTSAGTASADAAPSQPTSQAPWTSNPEWVFNSARSNTTNIPVEAEPTQPSSEQPDESQPSYTGKGKARAVEVEDAPDPEA
jgi:E3 ubiquitin-protein ligase synoviolin